VGAQNTIPAFRAFPNGSVVVDVAQIGQPAAGDGATPAAPPPRTYLSLSTAAA
jgi:hypothetical protein